MAAGPASRSVIILRDPDSVGGFQRDSRLTKQDLCQALQMAHFTPDTTIRLTKKMNEGALSFKAGVYRVVYRSGRGKEIRQTLTRVFENSV